MKVQRDATVPTYITGIQLGASMPEKTFFLKKKKKLSKLI